MKTAQAVFEAERNVIGLAFLDPVFAESEVFRWLKASHFTDNRHIVIFNALRCVQDKGITVDAITVCKELKRQGRFAAIGGHDFITEIVEKCVITDGGLTVLFRMIEGLNLRLLANAASEIVEDCENAPENSFEVFERSLARIAQALPWLWEHADFDEHGVRYLKPSSAETAAV